jgi:hypothetical protein
MMFGIADDKYLLEHPMFPGVIMDLNLINDLAWRIVNE